MRYVKTDDAEPDARGFFFSRVIAEDYRDDMVVGKPRVTHM